MGTVLKTPAPQSALSMALHSLWQDVLGASGGWDRVTLSPIAPSARPDRKIWDGRFANNGWLQELPDPISKITWDNVVYMSPATAQRLGVQSGYWRGSLGTEQASDVVEVRVDGDAVRMPVWVLPGQADNSVLIHIGRAPERRSRR